MSETTAPYSPSHVGAVATQPTRMSGQTRTAMVCVTLAGVGCVGNALYASGEPGGFLKFWSPAMVAGAMIAFLVVHGGQCYGGRQVLRFVVGIFLIGWLFETVSVLTGFPFGNYHYTAAMKPFIGHVPVSVLPAYCVMGYVSWSMARIFLDRRSVGADNTVRFALPVLAAFLMVLWDLSMDPLRATVEQRWIWRDGGLHYGVPLENYLGWGFVTWIMFQSFAVTLPRGADDQSRGDLGAARWFWLSVPLMYISFAVEYVLNPLSVDSVAGAVVSVNGSAVSVETIYRQVALLAATTMLPAGGIAAITIFRSVPRPLAPVSPPNPRPHRRCIE